MDKSLPFHMENAHKFSTKKKVPSIFIESFRLCMFEFGNLFPESIGEGAKYENQLFIYLFIVAYAFRCLFSFFERNSLDEWNHTVITKRILTLAMLKWMNKSKETTRKHSYSIKILTFYIIYSNNQTGKTTVASYRNWMSYEMIFIWNGLQENIRWCFPWKVLKSQNPRSHKIYI